MPNECYPIGFLRYIRPSFIPLFTQTKADFPFSPLLKNKQLPSKAFFETEYAYQIFCLYISTYFYLTPLPIGETYKKISIKDNYQLVHIFFGYQWKYWCFFIRLIQGKLTFDEWKYLHSTITPNLKANNQEVISTNHTSLSYENLPQISVIVPTRNRNELLNQLILSFESQTIKPYEIIIIDQSDEFNPLQNSTINVPIIHIHQTDKKGPAAARNRGLLLAQGEFQLFVDDDMIIPNHLIEAHLSSFTYAHIHASAGVFYEHIPNSPAKGSFLLPSQIPGNNFMTTKHFWDVMKGFDETLDGIPLEDTELFLRSVSSNLLTISNQHASVLHLKYHKGGMREFFKEYTFRLYTNDIRFLSLYKKHYPNTHLIWFKFEHLVSYCYGIWVNQKRTALNKCLLIFWRLIMECVQLPLFWWRNYLLNKK